MKGDITYRLMSHPLSSYLYRFYEPLYLRFYRKKKEKSLSDIKRLKRPVISVGNITVGGTGKTPVVISLARESIKRGIEPCILSRGYKGRLKGPVIVSCRTGVLLDEEDVGDEPVLISEKLQGVPVIVGRDRFEAGNYAERCLKYGSGLFILDDGYQHWRLHRDINILLVSAINPFGNMRLFPFGPLREPVEEVKRADIIALTMTNLVSEERIRFLEDLLRRHNPGATLYRSSHEITGIKRYLYDNKGIWRIDELSVNALKNRRVTGFAGIGNPESFRLTLISCGMEIVDFNRFMDHHRFTEKEVSKLIGSSRRNNSILITTEKDLIRCRRFLRNTEVYTIDIDARCPSEFYEEVFSRINPLI